jgi:hypothetical protein
VRQLLNWRFVAALVALAGLALLTRALFADDDDIDAIVRADPVERRIDLMEPVFSVTPSEDFQVGPDGVTTGSLDVVLPGPRFMRIAPGTLGEISCGTLTENDTCAIFADMLGDAVIWFSILPRAPRSTVELPPVVELEDGEAILENGWRIPFPPVIERLCDGEDIPSFADFLERFGPESTSIVDLNVRQLTAVRCAADADA